MNPLSCNSDNGMSGHATAANRSALAALQHLQQLAPGSWSALRPAGSNTSCRMWVTDYGIYK